MFSWILGGVGHNFSLHRFGIPGQHEVGEQGEGAADGGRILVGSAMFGLDTPGQKSALQGMERFTLGQQAMISRRNSGLTRESSMNTLRMTLPIRVPHS